eukprot:761291-Hanusia_phi.AAC.2
MATTEFRWRLVGDGKVRSCKIYSLTTAEMKKAVGRYLSLSSRWIEIARPGCSVQDVVDNRNDMRHVRLEGEGNCYGSEAGNLDEVTMVSIVMPRFARFCNESVPSREQKPRVTNQKAVRDLAWQPGLLSHEDTGQQASSQSTSYPIYVSGIRNLPGKFLRIDLESHMPTLSCLRQRLTDLTGIQYDIVFGEEELGAEAVSGRKYLHMLKMSRGSVVRVVERRRDESGGEGGTESVCARSFENKLGAENENRNGGDPTTANLKRNRVTYHGLEEEEEEEKEGRDSTGRCSLKRVAPRPGQLWAGSSRKRCLSSGRAGARGPGGDVSCMMEEDRSFAAEDVITVEEGKGFTC